MISEALSRDGHAKVAEVAEVAEVRYVRRSLRFDCPDKRNPSDEGT